MRLPGYALRHHHLTLLLSLILVLLGLVAFLTMPRSEDPMFDFPNVMVTLVSPGTNPADLEDLVVDPIEAELNELDDLKTIKTDIEDGMMLMEVEFLYGSDPDDKEDDVASAINRIRDRLPANISKLEVRNVSPSDVGILQLALSHRYGDYRQLRPVAEQLEQRLERVAGVKRVDLEAMPELEVQITLDPAKLFALELELDEVLSVIQSAGHNIPGGHTTVGDQRLTVRTSGDFANLSQIEDSVIGTRNGHPLFLRDLATVTYGEGLPGYRARFAGQDAVFLNVIQRAGSNIFELTDAIDRVLADYRLPPEITLHRITEQRDSVAERVNGFFTNLLQGLLLVALTSLLVLGRRPSVVVIAAIPVSIFIAIGWLDLSGFGLQQMSIVGLVIALGLLVDNAIVVTENILRLRNGGLDAEQAARRGSRQVATAIVSGTLTTVLAFIPMLMMQNGSGTFIRSMPVSVILTLLASLLVALTLTPLMARRMARRSHSPTAIQRGLNHFADGPYLRSLGWSLRHPWLVIVAALLLFVAAVSLFPKIGVSLFPKAEKPMLLVNLELADGASFYRTQKIADEVAAELQQQPLVSHVAVNVGRGNPRIYYNVRPGRQKANFAQLFVTLTDADLARVEPLVEQLREQLNHYPGVEIRIKELQQGPPTEAPISVRLLGENWETLRAASLQVERLVAETTGTVNINNPIGKDQIDLRVAINRDKAALLGIPLDKIDRNARAVLVGLPLGRYRDAQGDDYAITLRSAYGQQPTLEHLQSLKLKSAAGAMVPFNQIAQVTLESNLPRLQHHNMERMARVTADVRSGFNTEQLTNRIATQLAEMPLPAGVRFALGGEQESRKESFGGMAQSLIVALLGIFTVLVVQFRSFRQPLIVLMSIPFAATGAFFGLYLSGYTFSFTAFIGLTSLVGIVVNNAIILVDSANHQRFGGASLDTAIRTSATARMTPILLTSVTTMAGLLPLTLSGSTLWTPMGIVIIAGLLLSTLVSLFLIPVLYRLLTPATSRDDADQSLEPSGAEQPELCCGSSAGASRLSGLTDRSEGKSVLRQFLDSSEANSGSI
ncbi:efflux RND transporter permease subunit [Motiliproteus sediminis]|uniref:efflux RND transporter permease subunit n=1 Tax=Motiliproteus sediminis TaxID=1468178 RepID=UPI001AEF9F1E|nr:efflux RND transporter permease subunit [Motiliproteus sediminis]